MWVAGRTHMTKFIDAFRNFAKTPENKAERNLTWSKIT
jgi:hypothetical protein